MLKDVIQNFSQQLDYEPVIENADNFSKKNKFVVCGMGGSNLAVGIIESWKPKLDVIIHRDYSLPEMEETELKNNLVIISSYSGNTEETISAFHEALARKLPLITITAGGKLLELTQKHKIPYIQIPKVYDNPRFAIGYSIKATLKAMGEESILNNLNGLFKLLDIDYYEAVGKELAEKLRAKVPLIYSSGRNAGLARYWKISFNENAKIPAFYNFLPELNHNEIIGFVNSSESNKLNHNFAFVFLKDPDDNLHTQKRITATKKLLEDGGFEVLFADAAGPSLWHKSFSGIIIAMWVSYYLAEHYGVDPEDVSMLEDFKKSLVL